MIDLAAFPPQTAIGYGEIVARFIAATALGSAIGYERESKARPAGLRTHMLIALGAAVFCVIALEIAAGMRRAGETPGDIVRIVEAVTAGVAFVAAGSVLRLGGRVEGLTTGASLWLAGAVGLACGVGLWLVAAIAVVVGLFVLAALARLSARLERRARREASAGEAAGERREVERPEAVMR